MKKTKPIFTCDLCDGEFHEGQGYGLRGRRDELQYTSHLGAAEKHICNGCMISVGWCFEDSVGKKVPQAGKKPLRF